MAEVNSRTRRPISTAPSRRSGSHSRRVVLQVERLESREVLSAIATPPIYQNPFMAPNNFSEIHLNSFQTDTFSVPGPASSRGSTLQQHLLGPVPFQIAGTLAFDSSGQIVTIRVGPSLNSKSLVYSETLLLINPTSLSAIASVDLPSRFSGARTASALLAEEYFYLNNLDQVVCVTANQEIRIYGIENNQFVLDKTYDLSGVIDNSSDVLNSVLPDSAGNLWFITTLGDVGYVNPANGSVSITNIRDVPGANPDETDTKSFATDGQGGVYVLSDYALYRFQVSKGNTVQADWRAAYDRGTREKPGQNQQGSGTTPTVFDDFAGNEFVTITDNAADPFMHVNVYNAHYDRCAGRAAGCVSKPAVPGRLRELAHRR